MENVIRGVFPSSKRTAEHILLDFYEVLLEPHRDSKRLPTACKILFYATGGFSSPNDIYLMNGSKGIAVVTELDRFLIRNLSSLYFIILSNM